MLYGWCRGIEDAQLLKTAGYDYIECPLASLQLENEQQFQRNLQLYLDSPLPVHAVNIFFPGDLKVVGPEVDVQRVRTYITLAASALEQLGTKVAVFGSGRSRNIPPGWERDRAVEQIVNLLNWIADEFSHTGTVLAIEPLNTKESNIITSVGEAVEVANLVNRKPIRVLADFYHMDEENDPLESLVKYKDWLAHIHLADSGRLSPGTGTYPYAQFAENLLLAGYAGTISAECQVVDMEGEFSNSLSFMKKTFNDSI